MKRLLIFTALIETGTGLALIICPSWVVRLLLNSPLEAPVALTLGRVAGAAVLVLGLACWLIGREGKTQAAKRLVTAMTIYNGVVSLILLEAGLFQGQAGIALWPAVILHVALTPWCILSNRSARVPTFRGI